MVSRRAPVRSRCERRRFGPTHAEVPVIGQGTWLIDEDDRKAAIAALRHGFDLGMTHIDTAEMYGDAERIVARPSPDGAMRCFWFPRYCRRMHRGANRDGLRALAVATAYRPAGLLSVALARIASAGGHVRGVRSTPADGKILSWGVSNFDVADLDDAYAIAGDDQNNLQPGSLSPAGASHRTRGVAVVRAASRRGRRYAPFGHGEFPSTRTPGGRVLKEIADAHDATRRQVALRFLVRQPPLFTIPKASKLEHAAENAVLARCS